jgi:hypothetical protein
MAVTGVADDDCEEMNQGEVKNVEEQRDFASSLSGTRSTALGAAFGPGGGGCAHVQVRTDAGVTAILK